MRSRIMCLMLISMFVLAGQVRAGIVGGNGYIVQSYYSNPNPLESMTGFDWDDDSNLYYSTGKGWDVGFSFYKYDGSTPALLYSDANAFAGSRVKAIGEMIYFSDGGTYSRWTNDYFRYDPSSQSAPVNMNVQSDIYGLETRDGTDFWAAGGWNSSIYYSTLDVNGGLVSNPLVSLGLIGGASGPMAFDAEGNLYYAEGYVNVGFPSVYRWSAAEVAAAIADPKASPLSSVNHKWATLSAGSGVSGMVFDDNGNLLITATSFIDPSELHRLFVVDGVYNGYEVLAKSDERLGAVRVRKGKIYTNTPDGIFIIIPGRSMAVYNQSSGNWLMHFADGSGSSTQFGSPAHLPVSGDFDGDGQSDIAVYHEVSGYWYILMSGSEYAMSSVKLGGSGYLPVSGDFDGDGKTDFAVYNETTGHWVMLLSGSGYDLAQTYFGAPGYVPVSGDFDGDGKTDIAIYNETTGHWVMLLSGSGYDLAQTYFGAPGYAPVSGDFDGDGKTDIVLYHQASGFWYALLSGSGYQLDQIKLGDSGYIAAPGDFDRDGKTDFAVYHEATGYWWMMLSGSGYAVSSQQFGGSGYVPVM